MNYDISILVPIYNVSGFIERCAVSLFEQTYDNIEYIFIDDCSPDNSIEILENVLVKYPNRAEHVKILKHEVNKGLAGARNTAIANATGEYILHIDSDDYVELTMVAEILDVARQEEADIIVFDFFMKWKNEEKYFAQNFNSNKNNYLELLLTGEALPAIWNKCFRRSLYVDHKIEAIEGVNFGEDFSVTPLLCYYAKKIVKINKAYIYYVQYNNGAYTKNITKKNVDDLVIVFKKLYEFFIDKPNVQQFIAALEYGKQAKKVQFYKSINTEDFDYLSACFIINHKNNYKQQHRFFDRLLLKLDFKKKKYLLWAIVNMYRHIFLCVQTIKGRKK